VRGFHGGEDSFRGLFGCDAV